ncbi:hypothetical protein OG782_07490 [Streptomyces sp. NBC_00876]|uniref:hypothetical protein n=1 Tax=Streptomyces sp. NBC_00876 TaxID=2975853 RepID=UPI00386DDA2D|nr:hypothetical protein OG782_07490 [Streptomyces sp. NBC_00876]
MSAQTYTLPPVHPAPPAKDNDAERLRICLWRVAVTSLSGIGRHSTERYHAHGSAGAR